jgi:hypothetical protein
MGARRVANGMNNRQEVQVRTGALTEGTRHRGDKGVELGHQPLCRGAAPGGPARGRLVEVIGARRDPNGVKRRKGVHIGQAGPQQRKPEIRRRCGRSGDGTSRSLLGLTRGGLQGVRMGGRREDERTSEPMALQIKDWRAVSGKQPKGCLNPEGNLGGEGKRWRRRWRKQS